jgi:hypothetical protein
VPRITGISGALYIGSTPNKVADIYDWQFETSTDLLPVDIKGDFFHKFVPEAGGARFTAKRRNQASAVLSTLPPDAALNGTQLLFRLDLVDASGSYTQITGQGYCSGGSLNAPRDVVDDTVELTFDGVYAQS